MKATIRAISETEVERLGRCAAECELWAAESCSSWEQTLLLERAKNYRNQQFLALSGLHKCAITGCLAMVAGSAYCSRCAEEVGGSPYLFANILGEFPLWARRLIALSLLVGAVFVLALASIVL